MLTGEKAAEDSRFIPASPAHVKASLVRALFSVFSEEREETEFTVDIRSNILFAREIQREYDVMGVPLPRGGLGNCHAVLAPETRAGVNGTRLTISFKGGLGDPDKKVGWTSQLIDEVACLVDTIGPTDPKLAPAGPVNPAVPIQRKSVVLPQGTTVKLVLRDVLSSQELTKHRNDPVTLEVAEDVVVQEAIVIRKGALGIGRFSDDARSSGYFGRSGTLLFDLQSVTAVDGQTIKVFDATEVHKGIAASYPQYGGVVGLALSKGTEAHIRAGTGFSVETVGVYKIELDK